MNSFTAGTDRESCEACVGQVTTHKQTTPVVINTHSQHSATQIAAVYKEVKNLAIWSQRFYIFKREDAWKKRDKRK
jgi:hypothetical protein